MKCIYCSDDDPARFRGVEHVVPQSFGTFGANTPTLTCVCDDCNAYFGRELDQLLARETLEGISRYTRGQRSREARPQRRLSITLGEGQETGAFAGMRVAIDGVAGALMPPRAQFHAFNFETGENEVYFREQIAGLTLPEIRYGGPGTAEGRRRWQVKVLAPSKEEHDALVAALQSQGIPFEPGEPFPAPSIAVKAGATVPVDIEGEIDTPHKRALAKILMNFAAWTLGHDEVLKPRWNFLRRYVREGEGLIKARLTQRPFWNGQETEDRRFADDSIDIRIENHDGNIVGAIQFYGRSTCEMILVENDALLPEAEIGYRFTPGSEPIRGEKRRTELDSSSATE